MEVYGLADAIYENITEWFGDVKQTDENNLPFKDPSIREHLAQKFTEVYKRNTFSLLSGLDSTNLKHVSGGQIELAKKIREMCAKMYNNMDQVIPIVNKELELETEIEDPDTLAIYLQCSPATRTALEIKFI